MLKHELVETLGIGDDSVIMGPIEDYVQALAIERELPTVAVAACALRIEEAGPALRAALARAAEGKFMTADEATLFFRGLHILGAARDRQGFQLLLRLLRSPADELEFLLGDTVTESLARIVVGMFDGDTDALFGVIADRRVDGFVRDALMMAAAFLTWEGRIDRARMQDFLERFHADELADEEDYVWTGWVNAIGLLGMRELAPLVRNAWDEELIPEGVMEPDDFEKDLAAAEAAPDDGERFERANVGYIEDAVLCLEGTVHFATMDEAASDGAEETPWTDAAAEPYVNPLRHVGRNDPCPCGSGKKYKKCCLAA